MAAKILATLTAVIGSVAIIYSVLAAFGLELDQGQQDAITAVLGLVLVIAGIWFHPQIPVGVTGEQPPP